MHTVGTLIVGLIAGVLTLVIGEPSRILASLLLSMVGLAGVFDSPHNTWIAANICQIKPDQAIAAWDDAFFRKLNILVTDPTRRSTLAWCQGDWEGATNGWLHSVRWDLVTLYDHNGAYAPANGR